MQFVKLLSALLVVLSVCSIAASQACPSSGIACYPGDCCGYYQQCSGTTFWPKQVTAPGTVCKAGQLVHAAECTTPCPDETDATATPTSIPSPPPKAATQRPTPVTAAPTVKAATVAPTKAPATAAPTKHATVAPTKAPATVAPTKAPATAAPTKHATVAPTVAPTKAPATVAPTVAPTKAPTVAPTVVPTKTPTATIAPTKAPTSQPGTGGNPFGQLLMAYYSGIGVDTLGSGGVNAIAVAFFNPTPLANAASCDFNDRNTPCVAPATDSGSKTLGWTLDAFTQAIPQLSLNTAPKRGGKPTVFFSFGGLSMGGDCWDEIFSNPTTAARFGTNAANLVNAVYNKIGQAAYVGFDLDIEETHTSLTYLSVFMDAFRAKASYDLFPLQLCTLSGLANADSVDNFKVSIMQKYGPAQRGINFLNMMVANLDFSCDGMSQFWNNPVLDFIPAANKIYGVWGEVRPEWTLHEPGCTSGTTNLYSYMKQYGIGVGIWQWWAGPTTTITPVLNAVRSS